MKQLLIIIMVISLMGCKNTASEESERKDGFTTVLKTKEDSLYHEVMQGHDIGMARMSSLRKQSKQVQHELDSIQQLALGKLNSNYVQLLHQLKNSLDSADRGMYKWMEEFVADSATSDKTTRMAYLESEKIKVAVVRDNILNSLQWADSILKK